MRVQRSPVRPMHAMIASSSVSPYMWIVTSPRSMEPLEGDGIDAISAATARAFCPPRCSPASSAEDAERRLGRATALEQLDRAVQVDVDARRQLGRRIRGEAGALERLGAPPRDALLLGLFDRGVGRGHQMVI